MDNHSNVIDITGVTCPECGNLVELPKRELTYVLTMRSQGYNANAWHGECIFAKNAREEAETDSTEVIGGCANGLCAIGR